MYTENKPNAHGLLVRAYKGDAKTLLCFSMPGSKTKNFAGFTISCHPKGMNQPYFLYNKLQFDDPSDHARKKSEPVYSSVNAPIQKFRWLHVPGLFHQQDKLIYGSYTYTITPRYFDNAGRLTAIDNKLSASVVIDVEPFKKGDVELAFTRGFVQSAGFVNHFGSKAVFKPKDADLLFNTKSIAGQNDEDRSYSFEDEYKWSGFTAREKIFGLLKEVQKDKTMWVDVFAYDLNEPDVMKLLLALGKEGRIRIMLDNAALHHDTKTIKPEDEFEKLFRKQASSKLIKRGKFGRYQHNKVLIVYKNDKPVKVLSGSTNFSVTGMYVNSNHVVVFNNRLVAELYANVFEQVWANNCSKPKFTASKFAATTFPFEKAGLPRMFIHFSPHTNTDAEQILGDITKRIRAEKNSVLFAVMETGPKTTGTVAPALTKLHKRSDIFSAGITDSENDLCLYKPSSPDGLRVTGKPGATVLPAPFNKEPGLGLGHQVHHKFIVCGFNQPNAVVWFGSSNLALGGECANGDNLIEVRDQDIATVFALEAMALVDHFHFRDKHSAKNSAKPKSLFLNANDQWSNRYFEKGNVYEKDRLLFIGKKEKKLAAVADEG